MKRYTHLAPVSVYWHWRLTYYAPGDSWKQLHSDGGPYREKRNAVSAATEALRQVSDTNPRNRNLRFELSEHIGPPGMVTVEDYKD